MAKKKTMIDMTKVEGGLKLLGFILTVGTLLWKAAAITEQLKSSYNMLSYQMGELSKQVASDSVEEKRRLERVEQRLMGGSIK